MSALQERSQADDLLDGQGQAVEVLYGVFKDRRDTGGRSVFQKADFQAAMEAGMIKRECSYDEDVDIMELKPHPENPNQHPEKQIGLLAELIAAHGWRAPVTVSKRSGYIIRGHGRYYAAIELGETVLPVDYQEYESEEAELADLVADNHIAELAHRDDEILLGILQKVGESNLDLELTGYNRGELDKLAAAVGRQREEKPEVEFSEELYESSNYIVLYFDNDIDWLQALTLFDLKKVKAFRTSPGSSAEFEKVGIGRVINGADALEKLRRIFSA